MTLRVMLDTNILISAIVFDADVLNLLVRLSKDRHKLFVSEYIDHEFRDKIIEKWEDKAKKILLLYEGLMIPVMNSSLSVKCKLQDPKDEPVLSDAISNYMDVLLTGDKDFYDGNFDNIKIMTVKELDKYLDEVERGRN